MTNQHPITPPPELRDKWLDKAPNTSVYDYLIDSAARWGADQELEACCEWFRSTFGGHASWVDELRAARRPKPPTLKEQALGELASAERLYPADWSTIRKALEALPND
jgi:hypothetical protein